MKSKLDQRHAAFDSFFDLLIVAAGAIGLSFPLTGFILSGMSPNGDWLLLFFSPLLAGLGLAALAYLGHYINDTVYSRLSATPGDRAFWASSEYSRGGAEHYSQVAFNSFLLCIVCMMIAAYFGFFALLAIPSLLLYALWAGILAVKYSIQAKRREKQEKHLDEELTQAFNS